MNRRPSVKTRPQIVGVITTLEELHLAARLRQPPDFFELRLDHLCKIDMQIPRLPAPIILTTRHPLEGGANNLSIKQRRELLTRFIHRAANIDIELRSARALKSIVDLARRQKIGVIFSFHDFDSTPNARRLSSLALQAHSLGADALKIATRTDTPAALARLQDFAENTPVDLSVSAMGIGKLALASRVQVPSALIYAALKTSRVAGQPTLAQLRSALRRRHMR